MTDYLVTWQTEIEADSPEEAVTLASIALDEGATTLLTVHTLPVTFNIAEVREQAR